MRIAKFPSIFLSIILFFDLGIKRFISFFVINIIFILRLDNTNEKIIKYNDLILRFNPEFEHSWYRKGLAFARLKNYENAINCYDKAININPSFCDAIINKGNVFTEIGQYEKALKCFDDCLKINPKHFRAMSSKADCYFSFEDYSNAIKILDYILEQYPNSIIALFDKAMCLFRQKSCEKSLDLFNQIVIADIDVNDPLISYLFKKEAENKLKSVKAEAYFFKSSIEWEFDDLDSAIKSKINGLQITSDSAFEIGSAGALYYELEDYGNAEKYLLKSLSMHPNFEAALYYIGKTYIKLGRNKDATISFKKILEIDPDCKKAKEELSKIN